SEFWPMDPGAAGGVLDRLEREGHNLRRWQESGWGRAWVGADGGGWGPDDRARLVPGAGRVGSGGPGAAAGGGGGRGGRGAGGGRGRRPAGRCGVTTRGLRPGPRATPGRRNSGSRVRQNAGSPGPPLGHGLRTSCPTFEIHSRSKATTTQVTLSLEPRWSASSTRWSAQSWGWWKRALLSRRSSGETWLVRPSVASTSRSPACGANGRTSAPSVISTQPRNLYRTLVQRLWAASSRV